jgi:cytochrome c oxidase cbb3-type subunit 3
MVHYRLISKGRGEGMQLTRGLLAAACTGLMAVVAHAAAQAPQPPAGGQQTPAPAGQQPPAGRGRGRGGPATFPAQQRPPGDPALIARGQALYGSACRLCHGPDLRGGDMGGVNLLRSQLVLNDQKGELIGPVVRNGRMTPGLPPMPPFPQMADADITALAEYIHSVAATMRGQGSPPPGAEPELNIVVGDAAAGQAYFAAKCSACHSPAGDLKGLASRIASPVQLQNLWVSGGGGRGGRGGRGGAAPDGAAATPSRREVRVAVTQPAGRTIEGRLDRIDDFIVVLTPADGIQRSFRRDGAVPKIEIRDPLEGHRNLLTAYTDKDIHDVTAFLVTLK